MRVSLHPSASPRARAALGLTLLGLLSTATSPAAAQRVPSPAVVARAAEVG